MSFFTVALMVDYLGCGGVRHASLGVTIVIAYAAIAMLRSALAERSGSAQ